ncbi:MAG TPA: ectonucleotide pyrophosphatase/phosphodiesterase [Capsulimonadaceae bacterium]|jgi:predicted AlkP superfamily pyrophosphatase or phosphodiesterase
MKRSLTLRLGIVAVALLAALLCIFGSRLTADTTFPDVTGADTRPKVALPKPPSGIQHVIIVSFDGGKPAVIHDANMPVIKSMADGGAYTWEAQTIMPSITLVSHTSMLTGLAPAKHKILWNEWKAERGPMTCSTVFSLAKASGITTACIAGKEKFKHFNAPGAIDDFQVPDYHATKVAAVAADLIGSKKPGLMFVHFADPDGAGHEFGWGSDQQKQALADSDAALGTLRDAVAKAGIAKSTVFIISADHGGHARTHGSRSPEDMTIPWITSGAHVKKNFQIDTPVITYDTTATALWLLGVKLPDDLDGQPVTIAYK